MLGYRTSLHTHGLLLLLLEASAGKPTYSEEKGALIPPPKTVHQKRRGINISPTQKQV